jgi:hypothetical protein
MGGTPPSLSAIARRSLLRRTRLLLAFSSLAGKRGPLTVASQVVIGVTKNSTWTM